MKRAERIDQCLRRVRLFYPTNRQRALQLALDQAKHANDDPRYLRENPTARYSAQ